MKNALTMIGALALAATVSAAAQSTTTSQPATTDAKADTTVTGCLEKTKSGGFWLTKATVGGANMPVGTSGSTTTMPPAPASPSKASTESMTFNLENGKNLDAHVGHKIEVTGALKSETSGDELKNAPKAEGEMKARDLDVKSVKMIAMSCTM